MSGVERIAAERRRQVEAEGWSAEHDAEHSSGEMATAAACYAMPPHISVYADVWGPADALSSHGGRLVLSDPWPWDRKWDKRPPFDCTRAERIRALEKAGALVAAEIDRLLRVGPVECEIVQWSSRMCERGTKSCTTVHDAGPSVVVVEGEVANGS